MLTDLARKIEPQPPRDRDQIEDIVPALLIIFVLIILMPIVFQLGPV